MKAMRFGKGRKPSPSTVESAEDALARVRGNKAFFDGEKERGTYSRKKRDKLEKKVDRG